MIFKRKFTRLYLPILLLCIGFLTIQCKNEKVYTTIPFDSMLSLKVDLEPGVNINPFTQERYDFLGSPTAIGRDKKRPLFPFLILGSGLEKGHRYSCYFVASITFDLLGEPKMLGVSLPVDSKFRSVKIERFDQLNTEYVDVQLLINDWLENAFKESEISNIRWKNEVDIYRKIQENTTK